MPKETLIFHTSPCLHRQPPDISDWDRCGSVNIIEQETLSNQTEPKSISEFTTVSNKNKQAYHEVNSSAEGVKLLGNGFVVLRVSQSLWFARETKSPWPRPAPMVSPIPETYRVMVGKAGALR